MTGRASLPWRRRNLRRAGGLQGQPAALGIFVVNGALAAIAGICYTVMSQKYLPAELQAAEMIVIAAVILGGTRLTGGVGTLTGCVLGTLLLTMVTNSLILVGIPVYYKKSSSAPSLWRAPPYPPCPAKPAKNPA